MKKIERGDRVYNGLPSQLMNDLYDGLLSREEDIIKMKGWAILSLYLARTCTAIERKNRLKDKALEDIEKLALLYENIDKSNIDTTDKIMQTVYKFAHCIQEQHSCYKTHENWRKELEEAHWEI